MSAIEIALIVCTRNRATQLAKCLHALSCLEWREQAQLIIVDNGSEDCTQVVIAEAAPLFLDFARFDVLSEPVAGLARARNRGLAASVAPITAFTDDDCYPKSDFLIRYLEVFEDELVAFSGGRVLLYDERDRRVTIKESTEPRLFQPYRFHQPGALLGANMAFRTNVLQRYGGFDERFGAGAKFSAAEDTEIFARMLWSGHRGSYDPRSVVYHDHGRRSDQDVSRLRRSYGFGRGAYYAKFCVRKASRGEYMRAWYWSARGSKDGELYREVRGALSYLLDSCLARVRPGEKQVRDV